MADTKISELPAAGALVGTEQIPAVQASSNVYLTPTHLRTFLDPYYRGMVDIDVKAEFGAKIDGKHVTDAVTNSTTALTSATAGFVVGDVGKLIMVDNGTVPFISTIAAYVSPTEVTMSSSCSFTASSCSMTYGTDDTASVQSAINSVTTSSTILFNGNICCIGGALQISGSQSAQLLLPSISIAPDTGKQITIKFQGIVPPPTTFFITSSGVTPLPDQHTILLSFLNVGAGGAQLAGQNGGTFTNLLFVARDIACRMPVNPVLTGWNLQLIASVDLDGVVVDSGSYSVANSPVQTTATSYGIQLPDNNNGACTRLGTVNVMGFYTGYQFNEHTIFGNVNAWACARAAESRAGNHSSNLMRFGMYHCNRGIVSSGGVSTIFGHLNIEHASSGVWVTVYDIDDASNNIHGEITTHTVAALVGPVNGLLVNGAQALKRRHPQPCIFFITDAASVAIDLTTSDDFRWTLGGNRTLANPTGAYDGQIFNIQFIQDATGSRTITLGSKFKFAGGPPTLSLAPNSVDMASCQYDGTSDTFRCVLAKGFA